MSCGSISEVCVKHNYSKILTNKFTFWRKFVYLEGVAGTAFNSYSHLIKREVMTRTSYGKWSLCENLLSVIVSVLQDLHAKYETNRSKKHLQRRFPQIKTYFSSRLIFSMHSFRLGQCYCSFPIISLHSTFTKHPRLAMNDHNQEHSQVWKTKK